MKVLSLNAGSNSLKFEIVEVDPSGNRNSKAQFGRALLKGSYDNIGKGQGTFAILDRTEAVDLPTYGRAAELLLDWIEGGNGKEFGVERLADLERIGHRVVHGADQFQKPARINDEVIGKIEELEDLAPLHNKSALEVIHAVAKRVGAGTPMIAVFDTLFHQTIPDVAALYPLPLELAKKHKLRRYGFHGLSHRYLLLRYGQIAGRPIDEVNLITLHLEGGSSAAAIRRGKSIDTSMGFTPLEGLMMGTRSGDIDAAMVPYLMRKESMDGKAVEEFLNKKCGLLGVSGMSADTRELRKHPDHPSAQLALEMFSYRARKYVGAYLAALGGAEAIVFGGGIGENTPQVREEICKGLDCMGIKLDAKRNEEVVDCEGAISAPDSPVQIWVIPTEEALLVAYDAAQYSG